MRCGTRATPPREPPLAAFVTAAARHYQVVLQAAPTDAARAWLLRHAAPWQQCALFVLMSPDAAVYAASDPAVAAFVTTLSMRWSDGPDPDARRIAAALYNPGPDES